MNSSNVCNCDPQLIIDAKTDGDRFYQLFQQFSPVYLKLWHEFYVSDMDLADWSQKSAMVLIKIVNKYDISKKVTFGSFYKASLKNRLFDLIRKRKAQKRVPTNGQTSLNRFAEYYADTISDTTAFNPYEIYEFYEQIEQVSWTCSKFEKCVLTDSLRHFSPEQIAQREQVTVLKVKNALMRCRRKYDDHTRLTQLKLDDKVKVN
ncbi:hypothetical protein FS150101_NMOIFPPK_00441 [Fructilactobacillus sanfranciscensis]|uniref:sigma-70 family RNA polymerase sigma factor n=1 Tax=Fructilactobacillus sanfranciscensis TaxID=1625 RepID=UPI00384A6591